MIAPTFRSKRSSAKSLVPSVRVNAGASDQGTSGVLSPGGAVPGVGANPNPPPSPADTAFYATATAAELIEEAALLEGRLVARDPAWGWPR